MGLWRPIALVLASTTSVQFGTAIATTAFVAAGPLGAVWIRGLIAAGVMLVWVRPNLRELTPAQVGAVVPYAVALAVMMSSIYLALVDAPLGVVSAILMLGPLAVLALSSRDWLDIVCVGVATCGVAVLTLSQGVAGPISLVGIGWSLVAAVAFGAYIHTGKGVSKAFDGLQGVAIALPLVAILQTPLGIAFAGPDLWDPATLGALAIAAVLATVIPLSLEVTALRSLSMATFGLLLAFEPAFAAVAGFVIRGEALLPIQVIGIGLVILASVGSLGPRGWTRRLGADNRRLMADPAVTSLAGVSLFDGLSAPDLAAIAKVVELRAVPAGAVLTVQGEPADEFFMIADGEVEISVDGRELRHLGRGDYLGEIALVSGGPRTATAVASKPTRLFVLPEPAFMALLIRQHRLEDRILTTVADRMRYG
jgi:inner membrane transporter RhtA